MLVLFETFLNKKIVPKKKKISFSEFILEWCKRGQNFKRKIEERIVIRKSYFESFINESFAIK